MILRPTTLTENESTGKVVLFGDKDKSQTIQTDCMDLADWIVHEAICDGSYFGTTPINITCVKE